MSKNIEQKLTESLLNRICKHLSEKNIQLSKITQDGRINSAANETEITKELKIFEAQNEDMKELGLKIGIPNITNNRAWYDFSIESDDDSKDFFAPVNIKVTDVETGAADNLNCKMGLFYANTGLRPELIELEDGKSFGNSNDWDRFLELLDKNMAQNKNRDYYFLVVNKKNPEDVFWNSLRQLETLVPNGNNPPFQCIWKKNRNRVERTYAEARTFMFSALQETFNKRAQPKFAFDRTNAKYIGIQTDFPPEPTTEE